MWQINQISDQQNFKSQTTSNGGNLFIQADVCDADRGCGLTGGEGGASRSQHPVAAHLQGLGEVQVVEDEQVPRGRGDEHLGTVGRQTHPHQVAGVEELFVRAAVLCKPAEEKQSHDK